MYSFIFYCLAILCGFILFWFYDEDSNSSNSNTNKSASQKSPWRHQRTQNFLSVLGWMDTDFLSPSAIEDRFGSFKEVSEACAKAGLSSVRLLVAVDFTASNEWQGRRTFSSECLHRIHPASLLSPTSANATSTGGPVVGAMASPLIPVNVSACNPYQRVLLTLAQTWEPFLDVGRDGGIWLYKFGDVSTEDKRVLPLSLGNTGGPCESFQEVYQCYSDAARAYTANSRMKGPTSFAPMLHRAIQMSHCQQPKKCFASGKEEDAVCTCNTDLGEEQEPTASGVFTVLVILTDGCVNDDGVTENLLIKASEHPVSVVCVGVGDGPWTRMEEMDDQVPGRKFDNFQFVDFHRCTYKVKMPEVNLGLHMMMEIPDQFHHIKGLSYI